MILAIEMMNNVDNFDFDIGPNHVDGQCNKIETPHPPKQLKSG